jgi:branched-subunit amino acid ABC-type transport system permease component
LGGIFITGLALGAMNSVLPVIFNGAVSDAIAVIIVIILLLIKPKGFFGHEA